jgi:decaprenylphospho-beta-D-erythro-pentofuranosid-2-ulose 2-reductase
MRSPLKPGAAAHEPTRVLVIGGSSEIGGEIAARLVGEGAREIVLAGRDQKRLAAAGERLAAEGAERVETVQLDALDPDTHRAVLEGAFELLGGVDVAVLAIGVLGARGGLPEDIPAAREVLAVNALGTGSLLMETARLMRAQRAGTIVVLSSVAAERPRAANAVYCASKSGLDALAQALGDDLRPDGVRVMVVRPGFVRTRMTEGLPAAPMSTTAPLVAAEVSRGLRRGARTVWAPARLRWLMALVKLAPGAVFRRLPA